MKNLIYILLILLILGCSGNEKIESAHIKTVCNPVNISYRFRPETDEISRREAADPTVIKFKNEYWLFASKSGGYWYSKDLATWNFVHSTSIPTEDYAPTAIVLNDTIYLAVSSKKNDKVYKTSDPHSGKWVSENTLSHQVEDPAFFKDDDGKLYLYWGCSNKKPLYASEIDKHTFKHKGDVHEVIHQNPSKYGWEVRGDHNTEYDNPPWLEGCWMNKINGRYYLQYAAPGTREKAYSDGVYVGDSPLGPFQLAQHNPFSYKPEGFACGAGHGSTIKDAYGNYWHWATISISVKHIFERRIGFYPAFLDADGILYTQTQYGDYPMIVPTKKIESFKDIFPGWMLLSYHKPVQVSSTLDGYPASHMLDENIRTYWSAQSSNSDEWALIDLEKSQDIYAIQINFAEQDTKIHGRQDGLRYRYTVEASDDKNTWDMLVDRSQHNKDNSHAYIQLDHKVRARYLRIKNIEMPSGKFALSGFRVFGKGVGNKPNTVKHLSATRNRKDRRSVHLNWEPATNATGYNISYGATEDKLYHNYMVYANDSVTIRSLNADQTYYFAIEAFNENGIAPCSAITFTK